MRGAHGNPIYTKCIGCGVKIRTYLSRLKQGKDKWCSRECRTNKTTVKVSCRGCGKEWMHQKSQKGDKWCSIRCRNEHSVSKIKCDACGVNFVTNNSRIRQKRGKYCSPSCYWKSLEIDSELLKMNKKESTKKYRREHPEWCAEVKHRRRARESNGHFTAKEWMDIKMKQGFKCRICNRKEPEIKLTVDHIIPLAKNGSNNVFNIQGLCGSCNSKKHTKVYP